MNEQLELNDVETLDTAMAAPPEVDDLLVEQPDGSFIVRAPAPKTGSGFNENLAENLPDGNSWAREIHELVKIDVESRKERDKQYAEGIQRTGIGQDAPNGADFEGASRTTHPMLTKGCVDFASRAIKELYPAAGPCRTEIIGEQTEEKIGRAERKRRFMNWQLTTQITENRTELERLLSQVPLGGCQYKRWWWDPELGRPRTEAVYVDDVYTPYGWSDFYSSPRTAIRQRILRQEFERRKRVGMYVERATDTGADMSERTESSEAADKSVGVSDDALVYDKEGLRTVWEVMVLLDLEGDDDMAPDRAVPYIMHFDDDSRLLGLFRNWREDDKRYAPQAYISEWPFIPWRGGPAIGLAHLIGSLAAAATGSLRALLDAALIQNSQSAVKLKGGRTSGEQVAVSQTQITEMSAPANVDDIRKLIMPLPFPGPSNVLFTLLEWLTGQSEIFIATASEKIADAKDMPVGTALALIEHGSVNFSAIHSRLHNALKKDLEILHRLNAENLTEEQIEDALGDIKVTPEDFQGPVDVVPVSDPNIFSEAQRYAQIQAVLQLKADPQFAQFFKADKLLIRVLKLLQIQGIDEISSAQGEPERLPATQENYELAAKGVTLKVYDDQDDLAHLQAHVQFGMSPILGSNPLVGSTSMAPLVDHCRMHLLALYRKHCEAAYQAFKTLMSMQLGDQMSDDEIRAKTTAFVDYALAQVLGPMIMPGLQAMQAKAMEYAPKPPVNPDVAAKLAVEQARLDFDKTKAVEANQLEKLQMMVDDRLEALDRAANRNLAELAASIQIYRDQQKQGADFLLAQFHAQQEKQTALLNAVLAAASAPKSNSVVVDSAALQNGSPLIGGLADALGGALNNIGQTLAQSMTNTIAGLSEQQAQFASNNQQETALNRAVLADLQQSLQALTRAQLAPREGKIIRDASGTRVVSVPQLGG